MGLERLRKKIDNVDRKIIKHIAKRTKIVRKIGEYKKKHKIPVHLPQREKQALKSRKGFAKKQKINPEMIEDIFKRLVKESHKIENDIKKGNSRKK